MWLVLDHDESSRLLHEQYLLRAAMPPTSPEAKFVAEMTRPFYLIESFQDVRRDHGTLFVLIK